MEDIKMKKNITRPTTPYHLWSTQNLELQVEKIKKAIGKIAEIPGDHLSFMEATEIENMLVELKSCMENEIKNRKEQ
jgi:hypothetical protein